MIYLVIALAFVIAYMYDESNNLKEQIAELEAFQHNHAGQFVDTPNPVDIIEAANAGGAVDIDEKSFNEARNYLSSEKRQKLSEAVDRVIARRQGDDTPVMIVQSRVLDGTLDYSYLTPTHIRGTHLYSFRSGEWAEIIRIEMVNVLADPRHVFKVRYGDGTVDLIAICDHENYETN